MSLSVLVMNKQEFRKTVYNFFYEYGIRNFGSTKAWLFAKSVKIFLLAFPASSCYNSFLVDRDVAQLVARLLWEQDAAGSSPVISTM